VGATSTLALRGYTWTGDSTVEGRASTDYERETRHASTSAGYFASMGIRLLAGRPFSETDTRESPDVTIVNETLARRYFHGTPVQQVVGKRIAFGRPQDNSEWIQIVGVVSDEKQDGLDQPVQPTAYSSIAQHMQNPLTYVVRSTQDAAAVLLSARRAVSSVDRDLALTNVATLKEVVEASLEGQRFRTTFWRTRFHSVRASSAYVWHSARRPPRCFVWLSRRGCGPSRRERSSESSRPQV
jgi:hypothetical protein